MPRGGKRAGAGRKKGSANVLTQEAKSVIAQAAFELGGPDRMVGWAQEDKQNERIFWGQIYHKLLPHQVTGEGGGDLIIKVVADIGLKND